MTVLCNNLLVSITNSSRRMFSGLITTCITGWHTPPDFAKIIRKGLSGIRAEVLEGLDRTSETDPRNKEKIDFYRSLLIVMDAAIDYAHRHAEEARRLVPLTTDEGRKQELNKTAEACDWCRGNLLAVPMEASPILTGRALDPLHRIGTACQDRPWRFDRYMYPNPQSGHRSGSNLTLRKPHSF